MQGKSTPGISERHARTCPAQTARAREAGARCKCPGGPAFQAWVWLPHEGKKKRATFSGKGAKSAAKNWLADTRKPAREGRIRVGDGRVTVEDWLNKWLDERAPQDASERVIGVYRQSVTAHVTPAIGRLRLNELRRSDCNQLVSKLFEKKLARNTIKRTLVPLRLALEWAVDEEKIGANPAVGLELPKRAEVRELHVPTLAEVKRILDKADEDGREAILLDASLGLRKGELLALRWCDVDFKRGLVHVRRQNINGLIENKTKTKAGLRTAPLYATARATLEARAKRKGLTVQWLASDERLIFANAHGGPLHPRNWYRGVWQKARDAAGDDLVDIRLHDLRHFNVTALRELGMDGKLRSVVTGHTDTRTTERLYDHVRDEHIEKAASSFDPLGG